MASKFKGKIRAAKESDIPSVQQIYDFHTSDISNVVSFEEKTPSVDELTSRWRDISKCNLPFLVCELDNAVVGYAYATKFRSRAAYRHTVEESVYVSDSHQRCGIGKKLLLGIIEECKKQNVRSIIGVLGSEEDNPGSVILHRKLGFREVGTLHDVGYKNHKWIDRLIMEYIIK